MVRLNVSEVRRLRHGADQCHQSGLEVGARDCHPAVRLGVIDPGGEGVALDAQSITLGAQLVYFVLNFLGRGLFAAVIPPRPANEQK